MTKIITALIIAITGGILFIWWVNRAHRRKQVRLQQEIRDNARAERDKQLQNMKDKGEFDRWNHDG